MEYCKKELNVPKFVLVISYLITELLKEYKKSLIRTNVFNFEIHIHMQDNRILKLRKLYFSDGCETNFLILGIFSCLFLSSLLRTGNIWKHMRSISSFFSKDFHVKWFPSKFEWLISSQKTIVLCLFNIYSQEYFNIESWNSLKFTTCLFGMAKTTLKIVLQIRVCSESYYY